MLVAGFKFKYLLIAVR